MTIFKFIKDAVILMTFIMQFVREAITVAFHYYEVNHIKRIGLFSINTCVELSSF